MSIRELVAMIDDGVPLQVALAACDIAEDSLSDRAKAMLKHRQSLVKANIMKSLYLASQKASATPTAVASAAKAWLELSKEEQANKPISIEIMTE